MMDAEAFAATGQAAVDAGEDADFGKTLLPPIGSRGSRRIDFIQPIPDVDKFSRVMDKVMAERAMASEPVGEENASSHVIARGENQMTAKHGISKVGKGVVEKFHAARHNTAIMSAMGHPGLDKLVAREEEEKRKRKARLKELSVQRLSPNGRPNLRSPNESSFHGSSFGHERSTPDLPNMFSPPAQPAPASKAVPNLSGPPLAALPPAQQAHAHLPAAANGGAAGGRQGASKSAAASPTGAVSRSAPSNPNAMRPVGLSSGGASGEWDSQPHSPLRGQGTGRRQLQGGRWRRRTQTANPKSARNGDAVIRANSRVGRILAEFGGQNDWCSVTVMRHSLATILQANIRGWLVRRRWLANPQAVVEATKTDLETERAQAERRAGLKAELERRALTRKQKEKAASVLQKLFSQSMVGGGLSMHGGAGRGSGDNTTSGPMSALARAKWSRLNKNVDIAKEQVDRDVAGDFTDTSDSDMSDLGVEDMAMVKMRARTPPWQKAEQSQWEGQWAKLNTRAGRGNLDVVWDLADTVSRVQAVQQRRAERTVPCAPSSKASAEDLKPYDPSTQLLPASVVNDLLVHRYIEKYTRMGLMDHLPLRSAAEAAMQQQHQQQLLAEQQQHQLHLQQQQQMQQMQHLQHLQQHHQQQQQAAAAAAPPAVAST